MRHWAIGMLVLISLPGCALAPGRKMLSSRWAMGDADYRLKYGKPYRRSKKLPRMAKQMVDARHVAGKSGVTSGLTASGHPFAVGAQLGGFHYPTAWSEARLALTGSIQEGEQDLMAGAAAGVRLQPPTRLAPFIGVEGFAGLGVFSGWLDDDDCDCQRTEALATIGPEAGVHYWLNARARLTGSAGYRVTTSGRDFDHWYYGISLSLLRTPDRSSSKTGPTDTEWLDAYPQSSSATPPAAVRPTQPPPLPTRVETAPASQ